MPTTRPGYIWSGTEWVAIGQDAAVNPFKYQATAPTSPATGDIWVDSDDFVPSIDSAQFLRWRKTMVGGETSLSGNDDASLPLAYTPGYEQLYINGVLQVRDQDYTATTGNTVTGLTALVANDTVEVFSAVARAVADVYTQTQSDAKYGIIGTSAPFRISSGSASIVFASAGSLNTAITFPTGRFTVAPLVLITPNAANPQVTAASAAVTSTGFSLYGYSPAAATRVFHWTAIQMTSTTADG